MMLARQLSRHTAQATRNEEQQSKGARACWSSAPVPPLRCYMYHESMLVEHGRCSIVSASDIVGHGTSPRRRAVSLMRLHSPFVSPPLALWHCAV